MDFSEALSRLLKVALFIISSNYINDIPADNVLLIASNFLKIHCTPLVFSWIFHSNRLLNGKISSLRQSTGLPISESHFCYETVIRVDDTFGNRMGEVRMVYFSTQGRYVIVCNKHCIIHYDCGILQKPRFTGSLDLPGPNFYTGKQAII